MEPAFVRDAPPEEPLSGTTRSAAKPLAGRGPASELSTAPVGALVKVPDGRHLDTGFFFVGVGIYLPESASEAQVLGALSKAVDHLDILTWGTAINGPEGTNV